MGWLDKFRTKATIGKGKHTMLPKKALTVIRKYARLGYSNAEIADEIIKAKVMDYKPSESVISSWVHNAGLTIKRKKMKTAKVKALAKERRRYKKELADKEELAKKAKDCSIHSPIVQAKHPEDSLACPEEHPEAPAIALMPMSTAKATQNKRTATRAIAWRQSEKIKEQEQIIKTQEDTIAKSQEETVRIKDLITKEFEKQDAQPRPMKKAGKLKVKDLYDPKKSGMTEFEANEEHVKRRFKKHKNRSPEWQESPSHHGTEQNPNVCPCGIKKPVWATSKHDQPMKTWVHRNKQENWELNSSAIEYNATQERKRKEAEMLEKPRTTRKETMTDDTNALVIEDGELPNKKSMTLNDTNVADRYQKSQETKSFFCGKCNNLINYSQFTRTRAIGGMGLCRGCENNPNDNQERGGFIL